LSTKSYIEGVQFKLGDEFVNGLQQ